MGAAASADAQQTGMGGRVLALAMRPREAGDLVGQEDLVRALETQLASGRLPHFFILAGPVGSGKTTLARIIARRIHEQAQSGAGRKDTEEVNAANRTGVDDMRQLIEQMRYMPLPPSRAKVVILDEAHQLSPAAQNALITETEDVADHVFYIFCTSNPAKIIAALRRRAYVLTPRPVTDGKDVRALLRKAAAHAEYDVDGAAARLDELTAVLGAHDITSPGLVLQAAERLFAGATALESVLASAGGVVTGGGAGPIDTMRVCRSVASGDWARCAAQLQGATRSDAYVLRSCVLGYLKAVMLKATGRKALAHARAIRIVAGAEMDDEAKALPGVLAALCLACAELAPSPTA